MLTRSITFIPFLLFILSAPVHCAQTLIASGHNEYPPFMFQQGKKIIGVGPDLTTLIFAELGIVVESKFVGGWKRVMRKAKSGDIDLIVGIYKTADRLKYLSYPNEPYIEEPVVVFIHKDRPFTFKHLDNLVGKLGCTVAGESFGNQFDRYAEKQLELQRLTKISLCFKMMDRNRAQYSVAALYPGIIKIMELDLKKTIIPLTIPIEKLPAFQAFSKKSKFIKYLPYFNKRVIELKADGTVDALIDKHMKQLGKNEY